MNKDFAFLRAKVRTSQYRDARGADSIPLLLASARGLKGMSVHASSMNAAEAAASLVIQAAFAVHSCLGPGLLENAYVAFLAAEIRAREFAVRTEVALPVSYRDVKLDIGYRVDLIVEEVLLVEVKACAQLQPVHVAQILSYLRLGDLRLGMLINFHEHHLKNGIRRVVNSGEWRVPITG